MHRSSCGESAVRFSVNEAFAQVESSIVINFFSDAGIASYVNLRMSEQMRDMLPANPPQWLKYPGVLHRNKLKAPKYPGV